MGMLSRIYPPRRKIGLLWAVTFAALMLLSSGGAQPYASSSPTSSVLLLPADVAFDTRGNLFFSDTNRHIVQRIDPAGLVTIVAGSGVQGYAGDGGPALAAQLDCPPDWR